MNSVVVGLGCLPTVEGIVVPARALHLILISQSSHLFVALRRCITKKNYYTYFSAFQPVRFVFY